MKYSCNSVYRNRFVWKFLNQYGRNLTSIKVELIQIMILRDWDTGFKVGNKNDFLRSSIQMWCSRLFDSHNLPSPMLYKMFMDIEPFYEGNAEVARVILRWRDNQLKKGK